tara:strand:- start:262 stop:549 length:288 start_codon:yes stop_codon:yes gene_type:complete
LGYNQTIKYKKPIKGLRFQAMIVWETPREDSGDKWITTKTYKDFIDSLLWILKGKDGQIQLSNNPKIILATDNGYDVLWKINDNVKRLLKQERSK